MEHDEGALMQRFDRAVSNLTPEVTTLVDAGQRRGEAMRRRRRIASGAGVVMVAAVTVGAVAFGQGVFDQESAGPTNPNPTGVEQLEPATPRGLAAAAIDQFGLGQPKIVAGERPSDGAQSDDQLMVGMGYELDDAKVEIQVYTSSDVTVWREVGCDQPDPAGVTTIGCSEKALPDGTPAIHALIRAGSGSDDQTVYQAITSVRRHDQVVLVTETVYVGANDSTEYTEATLPIPMDDLIAVVTSPSVGTNTTAAYNNAGEHIEGFKDSMTTSSGSGSSSDGASEVTMSSNVQSGTAGGN